ncbi:MAG: matrixin family metalloprotease [Anaerolineae bacterium]|nr:matrixin family metalloprotease [Gloeobacterales cyanobacterium ES-bin-313]
MKRLLAVPFSLSLGICLSLAQPAHGFTQIFCNSTPIKWSNPNVTVIAGEESFPPGNYRDALSSTINKINGNPSNLRYSLGYDAPNPAIGDSTNQIWFEDSNEPNDLDGAPAITYLYYTCPGSRIVEADVIFDIQQPYTTSTITTNLYGYGGSNRPFQTTLTHELGHAFGLDHTNTIYNVMGTDYTHIHTDDNNSYAYLGEDATNGAVAIYGISSNRPQDLSVSHWKYQGTSGAYSTHQRTQIFNSSGNLLTSTTLNGEPVYSVSANQPVQVEFTYENNGADAQNTTVGLYLSPDIGITTGDLQIANINRTLNRNQPDTLRDLITIPSTLAPGYYYLGTIVDPGNSLAETDETNNSTYIRVNLIPQSPVISSFTPASGSPGTSVVLTGSNFSGISYVAFNGIPANFTVNSPAQITASVPNNATTGSLFVSGPYGGTNSATSFTVTTAAPPPTISDFSPTSGPVGSVITINGSNFTGVSAVKIGNLTMPFTVNSSGQILATIPANGVTGAISVTTPTGTATSSTFVITQVAFNYSPLSYFPIQGCRLVDTRNSSAGALGAGETRAFVIHSGGANFNYAAQGGSSSGCGIPADAKAVFFNFVTVAPSGSGDLQAWPFGTSVPTASVLNYAQVSGLNIANGLVLPVCNPAAITCTKDLNVQANQSSMQLVIDAVGYFKTP